MSDFKVIETQEQLDAIITARLERDRKTYGKQFEADLKEKGWKSPDEIDGLTKDLNDQISTLQNAAADKERLLAEKDAEIANGEKYRADLAKTRIAIGMGLPLEEAERISGANEDEWKADAKKTLERYQAFAAQSNKPSPIGSPESTSGSSTREQFKSWASEVFGN